MWYNGGLDKPAVKSVVWVGSALKDLKEFPDEVQREVGNALRQAQYGRKAASAKPLSGFGGASVLEVVEDFHTDTYRAVYTIRFQDAVYVLHTFQKKSTRGASTPKGHLDLVRARLRDAEELSRLRREQAERSKP